MECTGAEASASKKRRYLSHIDLENHYQFITFRTHDSVDHYLKKLAQKNLPNSKQQFAINEYLDQSINKWYLFGRRYFITA